ncbi:MAG: hypothetical protein A2365_00485 [Candidatus Nealsonbacteria bacterium RIFOXYB1_FULL_40_15]|uniref:NodB homology domain-containing protein n=2 Tax=Candidatus Nealsoniibacteriota TaxID=1817911 RepID=A0A1G2ETZ9_9BACT|nr:MAG: hypothetical protein A2365_00485 [Candidatus Nealsonbacteria bacterium RIFOXYB1_FULL_40_15]OGZ28748.1 MAG: hypothetical protein A2427_01665 [Candidatus Nealsonbacteria bacterium RIFOXYC1_FULL_40_7]OGZ29026.1 MAG: hypothetical protein A2562_00915 [Candidatus Nealsonbacteria bacterium RIFOXYD1_FULL_39_11]
MDVKRPIFVLSLDVELAWGTFDKNGLKKYSRHFKKTRNAIDSLLDLLKEYEIKATWAFVGHLFLDRCDKNHSDVLRPFYSWYGKDWHSLDPGTDIERDPFWYGKDILLKVKNAWPKQEIATHTFSHVIMDEECAEETARSQIKKCIELAEEEGIKIKSMVFPRNRVNHTKALGELGIRTFRGYSKKKRLSRIIDQIFARTPDVFPLKSLVLHDNVLEIKESMFLTSYDGLRKLIPSGIRVLRAKRGIKKAASDNSMFHLWLHPFNLAGNPKLLGDLEKIFILSKKHGLSSLTMGEAEELWRKS